MKKIFLLTFLMLVIVGISEAGQKYTTRSFAFDYVNGYMVAIGVYEHYFVATLLEGPDRSKQVVTQGFNDIIGLDFPKKVEKKYFKHEYSWGWVKTYGDHQELYFY